MDGSLGKNYLKQYISDIRPLLASFFEEEIPNSADLGAVPQQLMEAFRDMISRGKGIRGSLVKLAYLACGGSNEDEITRVSPFMELFHSAILVHDDFMDRDPLRRGHETIHTQFEKVGERLGVKIPNGHYGNTMAVCIGDAGIYLSWKMLLSGNFPSEDLLRASNIYTDLIVRLALGQSLDMSITGTDDIKEEDVLKVLWTKSGEYTALLPLRVGAALAGEQDADRLEALENYARCLGWAFQIQDDILGLYAEEATLGKPVGSDIREGKNTLLMLHLRKNGTPEQLEFMERVLGNSDITEDDVKAMKQLLKDAGSYQHVLDLGFNYVEEGKKYIPQITENEELQNILESLLVFMMERTK
jgi:geranylgeranyl diphosphate synthase type I